jgi:hypothetical protein
MVQESGATPIQCTYLHFQKPGGTRSEPFSTQPELSSTHELFEVGRSTRLLHHKQEDLVD